MPMKDMKKNKQKRLDFMDKEKIELFIDELVNKYEKEVLDYLFLVIKNKFGK